MVKNDILYIFKVKIWPFFKKTSFNAIYLGFFKIWKLWGQILKEDPKFSWFLTTIRKIWDTKPIFQTVLHQIQA